MIIKYEDIDRIINILQEAKNNLKPGEKYKFEGNKVNTTKINNFPERWCVKADTLNELQFIRDFFTKHRSVKYNFNGHFETGVYWLSENLTCSSWIFQNSEIKTGYSPISFEEFKQFTDEYKG